MKVKKKFISFLRNFCILSLCVVIGLAVSLQGFCASTLSYPLTLDYDVMSSWGISDSYMQGSDRWDKFKPISSTKSFDCSYTLSSLDNPLLPSFSNDCNYSLYIKTAFTIPTSSYNTVNSGSFANKSYITVSLNNNSSVKVYPDVRVNVWSGGTGFNVYYTFTIPEGAKSIYSFTFGCSFSSSYPTSQFVYLTVYPFQLTTVNSSDKIIEQFGSNYSKPNTSDVDKYNNAESQLYNGVQSSLDDITSQWNNIGDSLLQYQGAFLAVGKFFNNLTNIGWVKVVLILSIAIGMFALLLGAVLDYAKGTQIRNERENWKAETRAYRESIKKRKGRGK